jgi:nucleotide-binding universal stress UspA family protein
MVVPTGTHPLEIADAEASRIRNARALAYLEEKAQALREAGVAQVAAHVRTGQPAAVITEVARELHADLIIMSTQGLGADGRYTVGSVALKVLMTAPCPIFMVRINKPEPPKNPEEERWQWEGGANVG